MSDSQTFASIHQFLRFEGGGVLFSMGGALSQAAGEILPHIVEEDRCGCVPIGQGFAGVRQLAAAVEQGVAERLEDGDFA